MSGILIEVDSKTDKSQKDLEQINKALQNIESSTAAVTKKLSSMVAGLASIATAGFSVKYLSDVSVEFANMANKIALVTTKTNDLVVSQEDLLAISRKTFSTIQSTVGVYSTFGKSLQGTSTSTKDILRATEAVQKALALSGGSAESMNAAVIQFGQGLASGVLRGEELNSVMEQAPRLAKAIADSLQLTVGQMRALAMEGKLTSDVVFKGLLSQTEKLNTEFSKLKPTLAQGMSSFSLSMKELTNTFDSLVGYSNVFGKVLTGIANKANELNSYLVDSGSIISSKLHRGLTDVNGIVIPLVQSFKIMGQYAAAAFGGGTLTRTFKGEMGAILRIVGDTTNNITGDILNWLVTPLTDNLKISSPVEDALKELKRLSPTNWMTGGFNKETFADFFSVKTLRAYGDAFSKLATALASDSTSIKTLIPRTFRDINYTIKDTLRYFGIINNTLFTFRLGNVEAFSVALAEIIRGLSGTQRSVLNLNKIVEEVFTGGFTPLFSALYDAFAKLPVAIEQGLISTLNLVIRTIQLVVRALNDYLFNIDSWTFKLDFRFQIPDADTLNAKVVAIATRIVDAFNAKFSRINSEDVFTTIYGNAVSMLTKAESFIVAFANNVIYAFFRIYDEVIGHSWWTDTIENIHDTSMNLWSTSGKGIQNFKDKTIDAFRELNSAVRNALDLVLFDPHQFTQDFPALFKAALLAVGGLAVAILFPVSGIRAAILTAISTSLVAEAAVFGDSFAIEFFGASFLSNAAEAIGKTAGYFVASFVRELPKIASAITAIGSGLFRGLTEELPVIGGIFKMIFSLTDAIGVSGPIGLIGTLLVGMGGARFLASIGIWKKPIAELGAQLSSIAAIFTGTGKKQTFISEFINGLGKAGSVGFLTLLLSQLGALDSMFAGSGFLHTLVNVGGLAAMIIGATPNSGFSGMMQRYIIVPVLDLIIKLRTMLTGKAIGLTASSTIFDAFFGPNVLKGAKYLLVALGLLMASAVANASVEIENQTKKSVSAVEALFGAFDTITESPLYTGLALLGTAIIPLLTVQMYKFGVAVQTAMSGGIVGTFTSKIGAVVGGIKSKASGAAVGGLAGAATAIGTGGGLSDVLIDTVIGTAAGGMLERAIPSLLANFAPKLLPAITGMMGVIFSIPALFAAGTVAVIGGALVAVFGEGNSFIEKLNDVVVRTGRLMGFFKGTAAERKFGSIIDGENKSFGPVSSKYDFSKIDTKMVPDKLTGNLEKALTEMNTTLERAREEYEKTGEISESTSRNIKQLDSHIEKLIMRAENATPRAASDILKRLESGEKVTPTTWLQKAGTFLGNNIGGALAKVSDDIQIEFLKRFGVGEGKTKLFEMQNKRLQDPGMYDINAGVVTATEAKLNGLLRRIPSIDTGADPKTENAFNKALNKYQMAHSETNQQGLFGGTSGFFTSQTSAERRKAIAKEREAYETLTEAAEAYLKAQLRGEAVKGFQKSLTYTAGALKELGVSLDDNMLFAQDAGTWKTIIDGTNQLGDFKEALAKTMSFAERNAILIRIKQVQERVTTAAQQGSDNNLLTSQQGLQSVVKRIGSDLSAEALGKVSDYAAADLRNSFQSLERFSKEVAAKKPIAEMVFPEGTDKVVEERLKRSNSIALVLDYLKKQSRELEKQAKNSFGIADYMTSLGKDSGVSMEGSDLAGYTQKMFTRRVELAETVKKAQEDFDNMLSVIADLENSETKVVGKDTRKVIEKRYAEAQITLANARKAVVDNLAEMTPVSESFNAILERTITLTGLSANAFNRLPAAVRESAIAAQTEIDKLTKKLNNPQVRGKDTTSDIRSQITSKTEALQKRVIASRGSTQTLSELITDVAQLDNSITIDNIFKIDTETLSSLRAASDELAMMKLTLEGSTKLSVDDMLKIAQERSNTMLLGAQIRDTAISGNDALSRNNTVMGSTVDNLTYSKAATAFDELSIQAKYLEKWYKALPGEDAAKQARFYTDTVATIRQAYDALTARNMLPGAGISKQLGGAGVSIDSMQGNMLNDKQRNAFSQASADIISKQKEADTAASADIRIAAQNEVYKMRARLEEQVKLATLRFDETAAYKASTAFADDVTNTFTNGFKDVLIAKKKPAEVLREMASSYSSTVIDTLVSGIMSPLTGENGILRTSLKELGASIFGIGAGATTPELTFSQAVDKFVLAVSNYSGESLASNKTAEGTAWDSMKTGFNTTVDYLSTKLKDGFSAVFSDEGLFSKLGKSIGTALDSLKDTDFSWIGSAFNAVKGWTGFATGGAIKGPGTGTSDSIPAMLSNGEFIINAKSAAKFRPLLEKINGGSAAGSLMSGIAHFAEGGVVGASGVTGSISAAPPASAIVGAIGSLNDNITSISSSNVGLGNNVADFANITKDYSISSGKIIGDGFNAVSDGLVNMGMQINAGFGAIGLAMAPKAQKFDWIGFALSAASIGVSAYGSFNAPKTPNYLGTGQSLTTTGSAGLGLKYAEGGPIAGPGSGTSDSIAAMLSNGEFVINAASTKRYRPLIEAINSGKVPAFAEGGAVGSSHSSTVKNNLYPTKTENKSQQVFNINVTGDISRQTRREIAQMMPDIASGVNMHNKERGSR